MRDAPSVGKKDCGLKIYPDKVIKEQFDYTEWQREYFDRMSPEAIEQEALESAAKHPYSGAPSKIL